MTITTTRLELRRWRVGDRDEAAALYAYASDRQVAHRCGWMEHASVEESLATIATVLTGEENYAITLRGDDRPIGCVELKPVSDEYVVMSVTAALERGDLADGAQADEPAIRAALAHSGRGFEVGYWIGRPFWRRGLMSEALKAMLCRAFADLDANAVWGGHYVDNIGSATVMERCGLTPVCQARCHYPLIDEDHDCMIRVLPRERWAR